MEFFDNHEMYENFSNHEELEYYEVYEEQPVGNFDQFFKMEVSSPIGGSSPIPHQNRGVQKRRPGKQPGRPDSELSAVELERRERRRERNRHAAARCRDRRIGKVQVLETKVSDIKEVNGFLRKENEKMQKELENLRFQLNCKKVNNCAVSFSRPNPVYTENISVNFQTFTPLLMDKTFDFPVLPKELLEKARNESFTEFNKLANAV
jgi:hypothetical protein